LEHGVLVGSAVLLPLTEALDDPDTLQDFVAELGWELPASATAIGLDPAHVGAVVTAFEDVVALGDTVPDDATVAARYAVLLGALAVLAQDVYDLRTSIAAHLDAAFLNASQIAQQLPKRLFDYLLMEYVREANEPVYQALVVAGIFETTDVPRGPATFTSEHVQRTVHYDRARTLLTDPKDLFHDVYGWGDAAARLDLLIDRLYELGDSLGVPVALRYPLLEAELALNSPGTVVLDGEATQPELDLPLLATRVGGASAELGLSLFILHPETATGPPGLALGPYAAGELEESIAIDRFARWLLRLAATLDLKFGIAVVARPGQPLRIVVDPAGAASQESGSAVVELRRDSDPDEELPLVSVDGSGVSARGIYARAGVALLAGKPGLMFELGADQGRAGISLSGSDSFVARVLPSDIPDLNFDLGIAWSSLTGFSFKGAAALELAVAARAQLGPITLQTVYLALGLDAEGVGVVVAIAADARLGPVTATVDHVGVRFEARSKGSGGNLGPLDVRAQFEPPKGLGLAVDAVAVKGGGYIFFDNDKKQYAGVLELSLEDTVQLKVIGILDTILPGGQPGFSLLLIITAEFEPIQLGFGFTLNGVGGLAGINRTMLLDVLRAGLRNRTLDSILFPPDPVANAPKIISDLSAVFPPVEGRYAFGPQLKIGWGTPTLISAAVGIFIELPPPIRLAILAQIKAALPEEEAALIEIHMDAIGTYEQEKKRLAVDATLYDSQIVGYTLTGDMAMRLTWGDKPFFALSMGGFNPRYSIPSGVEFPALHRLELSMGSGRVRMNLATYFAVTSNTAQVGARLELRVGDGAGLHGWLGFDALFVFSPFSFVVDISAGVDLVIGGSVVMTIHLNFTLSGPTPWHAYGKASIDLFFFSISVPFDVRWGSDQGVALPDVDVRTPLIDALEDTRNWTATAPADRELAATLRGVTPPKIGTTDKEVILAHPFSRLTVRERLVPLDVRIDKFGNAAPARWDQFRIVSGQLNSATVTPDSVQDYFARAQFIEMSNDEKLSRPSFELLDAGAAFGSKDVKPGSSSPLEVHYEPFIIDDPLLPPRRGPLYRLGEHRLLAQVATGAAGRSKVWTTGTRKYVEADSKSAIDVLEPQYVIAGTDDLATRPDLLAAATSRLQAEQRLAEHLATTPVDTGRLQVVPAQEALT